MRFQTYISFTADDPEDALRKVSRWHLSRGATVLGITSVAEPVPYEGFPVQTDEDGNLPEVPPEPPELGPEPGPEPPEVELEDDERTEQLPGVEP